MKVFDPQGYEIRLDSEEEKLLIGAFNVLRELRDIMINKNCTVAQGGYEECPTQIEIEQINKTIATLRTIVNDGIYKIY